jgi:hypothetical protein
MDSSTVLGVQRWHPSQDGNLRRSSWIRPVWTPCFLSCHGALVMWHGVCHGSVVAVEPRSSSIFWSLFAVFRSLPASAVRPSVCGWTPSARIPWTSSAGYSPPGRLLDGPCVFWVPLDVEGQSHRTVSACMAGGAAASPACTVLGRSHVQVRRCFLWMQSLQLLLYEQNSYR